VILVNRLVAGITSFSSTGGTPAPRGRPTRTHRPAISLAARPTRRNGIIQGASCEIVGSYHQASELRNPRSNSNTLRRWSGVSVPTPHDGMTIPDISPCFSRTPIRSSTNCHYNCFLQRRKEHTVILGAVISWPGKDGECFLRWHIGRYSKKKTRNRTPPGRESTR